MRFLRSKKRILVVPLLLAFVVAAGTASIVLANCGPFTDVSAGICPFVLTLYYLGITAGTTSTTYSPANPVTRGQMAIFMGALYSQVKKTENPYRVATGMNLQVFNYNYGDQFQTVNTNDPLGFATDGYYDYVANVFNNKIDLYYNGIGHAFTGASYTTTNNNGPIVCDGNYIFGTNYLGTTVNRIQIRTGGITDPWVSGLNGEPNDMIIAEDKLVLAHPNGVDIVGINDGLIDASNLTFGALASVYAGDSTIWVAGGNLLHHLALSNAAELAGSPVALDGFGGGVQLAYDGQNVWVPLSDGSIDVVATRGAQANTIVDHFFLAPGFVTSTSAVVFTGQWVVAAGYLGTNGCGSGTATEFYGIDPATHAIHGAVGQCGSGSFSHLGFDGRHVWALGSSNIIYVE